MPVPMPMERKQAAYSNLVRASSSTLVFRSIPLSIYFDLISVSAERWPWRLQDERYAIQGEKYQGQQYSHIYFTRLHHMRNLLHALVPSWKPQLPGPPPFPFPFRCSSFWLVVTCDKIAILWWLN